VVVFFCMGVLHRVSTAVRTAPERLLGALRVCDAAASDAWGREKDGLRKF